MRIFIANKKLQIVPYLIMAILSSCSTSNTKSINTPISNVTLLSATSSQTQTPTVEAMPVTRPTPLALPTGLVVERPNQGKRETLTVQACIWCIINFV
jgi:hypothetical protein